MKKKLSLVFIVTLLAVVGVAAQAEDIPFLYNRQVVSKPEVATPQEAIDTKLSGTVKVLVTVDALGNVLSVGNASGPGSVCAQVTSPDVTALRKAAADAAWHAKLAPAQPGQPTIANSWVEFVFPKSAADEDETVEAVRQSKTVSPGAKAAARKNDNRFTVKGDVNYSAANVAPDYKGPVSTTTPSTGTDAGKDKYTMIPDGNYSAAAVSEPGYAVGGRKISGGVLNGKAMTLSRPQYPAAAMAVRATGAVSVMVLIDTDGKVFSAYAVSGHPLLRPATIPAACSSSFTPTRLMDQPVKVQGIITYNFVP